MCVTRIQSRELSDDFTEAQKGRYRSDSFSPETLDQGDESTRLLWNTNGGYRAFSSARETGSFLFSSSRRPLTVPFSQTVDGYVRCPGQRNEFYGRPVMGHHDHIFVWRPSIMATETSRRGCDFWSNWVLYSRQFIYLWSLQFSITLLENIFLSRKKFLHKISFLFQFYILKFYILII